MTIGQRIQNRREELGMTQEELAHKIGYKSKSSINKIELDIQQLTQSKIKMIADALETTPSYIMGWDEEKDDSYYIDREAHDLAEFLHKNPNYRVLFDASRKVKPEDIEFVRQMIERMSRDNGAD